MNITTKYALKQDVVFLHRDRIAEGQITHIEVKAFFDRDSQLHIIVHYQVRPYQMRVAGGFLGSSDSKPYKELQETPICLCENVLFANRMDLSQFLLTAPLT